MEQGTGKSKLLIDNIAHLWRSRKIDIVLIIAPKGAVPVWLNEQIPTHLPDEIPYVMLRWRSPSGISRIRALEIQRILKPTDVLRIVVMNSEAFGASANALDFAIDFLDSGESAMVVVDESHRIKTPTASTTKRIVKLRNHSSYRRILTGTVGENPFDLFSQFEFLDPTILETDSYTAFKSEYAELMPQSSGIMRHIAMRVPKKWKGRYVVSWRSMDEDGVPLKPKEICTEELTDEVHALLAKNARSIITTFDKYMEPAYLPTIVAKDKDGKPRYKNLERLRALIEPHSYRVLKADCLDLPEKTYSRYYTELSGRQRELYEKVKAECRIEWENGSISTFNKLTVYLRLQQIICGYVPNAEGVQVELFPSWKENPRIVSLMEYLEGRDEAAIIWCRFTEDIRRISEVLREAYGAKSVVQFYGAINDKGRAAAVADFRSGAARFMLAQQRAGGVAQTWTVSNSALYYSNTFALIDRLQSEDRCHRIGSVGTVGYVDFEAEETIDTTIINALRSKKEVADVINGDAARPWIGG